MPYNLTASSVFLFSTVILAISLYFFNQKHRQYNASVYLLGSLIGVILWMGGEILILSASGRTLPIWEALEAVGKHLLPPFWLAFVLYMVDSNQTIRFQKIAVFFIPAFLIILAALNDPNQRLYWPINTESIPWQYLAGLVINQVYLLASLVILLRAAQPPKPGDRLQIIFLLHGSLIAMAAGVAFLTQSAIGASIPLHWLVFGLNLVIYALVHLRLMDTGPVIDSIAEALPNGIIALSNRNIVTYLNPAGANILGIAPKDLVDQPVDQFYIMVPAAKNMVECTQAHPKQILAWDRQDSLTYLSICVTPFYDRWKKNTGKLIRFEDVTQQVQTEAKIREAQDQLQKSEEMYRQLVENISDILYILDCKGRLSYVSPAAAQIVGQPTDELIGLHYNHLLSVEDQAKLKGFFERTLAGEAVSFEYNVNDALGNRRTLLARQHRLMHDGQISGVHGILSDITERRQVEQALERRASQLAIVNNIGEKIAALMSLDEVLDSATHLIQTSFGYYHVALFLPDPNRWELVMRSASGAFTNIFPQNHHLGLGQGMVGWVADHGTLLLANDVRKEPRYTNFFPDRIQTRSELTVPVRLRERLAGVLDIQSPVPNAFDENDVRVVKTIADQIAIAIENARLYNETVNQLKETARKENMLRIQRDLIVAISSTNQVRPMLEKTLQTLSIELNVEHAMILLSDPGSNSLKIAASIGRPRQTGPLTIADDRSVAGWVARNGQPILIDNMHEMPEYYEPFGTAQSEVCVPLHSDNKIIGVIDLQSPQPNAFYPDDLRLLVILSNSLVMLIERANLFQEVEQARAELEARASALESANERLRELDRLKSQFLANMSHELRTPLNSVIGFSEIMLDNLAGPLNPDQEECIHNINDSGKHLLALINDLLDFSKIEAGRVTLEPELFNIATMLDDLRIFFGPLAEKKAQLLIVKPDPDLPNLNADRMRVKQILINLMGNASKFTPEGGKITVTCHRDGPEHVLFSVQDTGIGIRSEHKEMIFEEFRQVDGSMSREAPGTGLGLAISKRIVMLHHGEIWVESQHGEGACFYVRLPVNYQSDMI